MSSSGLADLVVQQVSPERIRANPELNKALGKAAATKASTDSKGEADVHLALVPTRAVVPEGSVRHLIHIVEQRL